MFTSSPHAGPNSSMRPPPTAGPSRMASCRLLALSRMALGRSSAGTIWWMMRRDAGDAVDHQDHHGMPHLETAGEEEHTPGDRRDGEERLRDLNQFAAIVAIGKCPGVQRKQQERQPVADHREARERRRAECLE